MPKTTDPERGAHLNWGDLARLLLLLGLATLVLPSVGVGTTPVAAQERAVEWSRFDVDLELREDGSFHVTERQQVDFNGGPFRGGFRDVALARIEEIGNVRVGEAAGAGTAAEDYTYIQPTDFVEDPNTYTYRVDTTTLHVEWGFEPAVNEVRTFVVEYDVLGGMRSYLDLDPPFQEISWIAVDDDLTEVAPVRAATMTIRLPIAVDPAQTRVASDGAVDDEDDPADHTEDGRVWTWEASGLGGGDLFEVGLQFPAMLNLPPPSWQQADDARQARAEETEERGAFLNVIFIGLGLALAVGGGLGTYGLWYARGRDPHTGVVADFLPQPPDDLPPGAAGTLLDERADEQDIVATLVDLGHRGVIKIEQTEGEGVLGFGGGHDFALTLQQDAPAVLPFEEELLQALFGFDLKAGATARLSEVKDRFTAVQPAIRDDLYAELVRRQYFPRSPEATRDSWRNFGVVAIVVAILAGCVGASLIADVAAFVWFPVVVVVGLALVLIVISGALPRKTAAGAEAAAKWRAFRHYLESIEKYEQLDEAKEIFDRYLPYAVAFGLERSWVQKFASVRTPSPAWYGGGVGGMGGGFGEVFDVDPYPGRRRRRRGGFGGGTVIIPGGGWGGGGSWGGGGGERRGGDGGGGGLDLPDVPDLQDTSDRAGRSLQGSSDSLFDMLNTAAKVFGGFSGGGGGGRGWRGGGGFGGGGFGGGGSRGGGGGGGGFH